MLEDETFSKMSNIIDYFFNEFKNIDDLTLRSNLTEQLYELDELFDHLPEWEIRSDLHKINLAVFGNSNCGKRDIIEKFTSVVNDISIDNPVKMKKMITLKDKSNELLMIRDDGDILPIKNICQWSDAALFTFDICDKPSMTKALFDHNQFLTLRSRDIVSAPRIFVGIMNKTSAADKREQSYAHLLHLVNMHEFTLYIEVGLDTNQNLPFLFEYAAMLALKYKRDWDVGKFVLNPVPQDLPGLNDDTYKVPKRTKYSEGVLKKRMSTFAVKTFQNFSNKVSKPFKKNPMLSNRTESSDTVNEEVDILAWMSESVLKQGLLKMKFDVFLTVTQEGSMFYHQSKEEHDDLKTPTFINLIKHNVKVPGNNAMNGVIVERQSSVPSNNCRKIKSSKKEISGQRKFELQGQSKDHNKIVKLVFKASDTTERDLWVEAVKVATHNAYRKVPVDCQNNETLNSVIEIQSLPANNNCAECGVEGTEWLSLNLGVFICSRCAGSHRSLGSDTSRVMSTSLDVVTNLQVQIIAEIGNAIANSVFEATLDLTDVKKPEIGSGDVSDWLRLKYIDKQFLAPLPISTEAVSRQLIMAIVAKDYRNQMICIQHATKDQLDAAYSDSDRRNALMVACQMGSPISVQFLLWAGASGHVVDELGWNCYAYALSQESEEHSLVRDILEMYGLKP